MADYSDVPLSFGGTDLPGNPNPDVSPTTGASLTAAAFEGASNNFITNAAVAGYNILTNQNGPRTMSQDDVNNLWKKNGLKNPPPVAYYNDDGINYTLDRALENQEAEKTLSESKAGIIATPARFLVGMVANPVNDIAALPAVGNLIGLSKIGLDEAAIAARTGLAKVGSRFAAGAVINGAISAGIEGPNYGLSKIDGQDYDSVNFMRNVAAGAMFGGLLHTGVGALGDRFSPRATPPQAEPLQQDVSNTLDSTVNTIEPNQPAITDEATGLPIQPQEELNTDTNGNVSAVGNTDRFNDYISQVPENPETPHLDSMGNLTEFGARDIRNQVVGEALGDSNHPLLNLDQDNPVVNRAMDWMFRNSNAIDELRQTDPQALDNYNLEGNIASISEGKGRLSTEEPNADSLEALEETKEPTELDNKVNTLYDSLDNIAKLNSNQAPRSSVINDIRSSINTPERAAANMIVKVDPQTRENALRTGIMQMMNDKDINVADIVRSDPAVGEVTPEQANQTVRDSFAPTEEQLSRARDRINNVEPARDTETLNKEDTPFIKFEDEFNTPEEYQQRIANTEKEIANIEALDNLGLYSISRDRIENPATAEELTSQLKNQYGSDLDNILEAGKLKIVDTPSDIPGVHPENTAGYTHPDGNVYIVAKNIDPSTLSNVVLHEIGGHVGLPVMLGDNGYNDLIRDVNTMLDKNDNLREIINNSIPENTPSEDIGKEQIGYLLENAPTHPIMQRLFSKLKSWMYRKFPSLRKSLGLTQSDLQQLARSSIRDLNNNVQRYNFNNLGKGLYSILKDDIDSLEQQLEAVNQDLEHIQSYNKTLKSLPKLFDYVDAGKSQFTKYIDEATIGYNFKVNAASQYETLSKAASRYREQGIENWQDRAIDFLTTKIQDRITSAKKIVVADRATNRRNFNIMNNKWKGNSKAGLDSFLLGTNKLNEGANAYNVPSNKMVEENKAMRKFTAAIKATGIDLVNIRIHDEEIQVAKWRLDHGQDVSDLSPNLVQFAKTIGEIYNDHTNSMSSLGLTINKIKGYIFNNANLHSQDVMNSYTPEEWADDTLSRLNLQQTADNFEINPSQLRDKLIDLHSKIVNKGLTIGHEGTFNAENEVDPDLINNPNTFAKGGYKAGLRIISNNRRKLAFKSAEAEYAQRMKYGNPDLIQAVKGTLRNNSNKIAMLKTFGVNYEDNMNKLIQATIKMEPNEDIRNSIKSDSQGNTNKYKHQLECIDGRINRLGGSKMAATIQDWTTGAVTIAHIGGYPIAALSDLSTTTLTKARQGIGAFDNASLNKFQPLNAIHTLWNMMTPYSQARKDILDSVIAAGKHDLQSNYRFSGMSIDPNTRVSKINRLLQVALKWSGAHNVTTSNKFAITDATMQNAARRSNLNYSELDSGFRDELSRNGIQSEDWDLIRQIPQMEEGRNRYLSQENIYQIRDKVQEAVLNKFPEISGNQPLVEQATDRYMNTLRDNLHRYYLDAIKTSVPEGDEYTKYISTWGGTIHKGTVPSTFLAPVMQFKAFAFSMLRSVIGREIGSNSSGFSIANRAVQYAAVSILSGYTWDTLRNLTTGKMPPPVVNDDGTINWRTVLESAQGGGGLPIFGDILTNTSAWQTPLDILGGPAYSDAGRFVKDVLTSTSSEKLSSNAADLIALARKNVPIPYVSPIINSIFGKSIFDYLVLYNLQDLVNPGFAQRYQDRIEAHGQKFYVNPTAAIINR